jgi:hypothetical protein
VNALACPASHPGAWLNSDSVPPGASSSRALPRATTGSRQNSATWIANSLSNRSPPKSSNRATSNRACPDATYEALRFRAASIIFGERSIPTNAPPSPR